MLSIDTHRVTREEARCPGRPRSREASGNFISRPKHFDWGTYGITWSDHYRQACRSLLAGFRVLWGRVARRGVFVSRRVLHPPERIDPTLESSGVVAHHVAKYVFANEIIGPGRLLDVGCGVGYGTSLLGKPSRVVFGVDVAQEAVTVAKARYAGGCVNFVQANGERLPFRDRVFDGVTCFEAIEHFEDPERHVTEVARVLKLGGAYVLSTPRLGMGGAPELNPYHRHEFGADDLLALLRPHFAEVALFGQRRRQTAIHFLAQKADILGLRRIRLLRPLVRWVSRLLGTEPIETAPVQDFVIDVDGVSAGSEFVVVCHTCGER